jgi:hypothetical protein
MPLVLGLVCMSDVPSARALHTRALVNKQSQSHEESTMGSGSRWFKY